MIDYLMRMKGQIILTLFLVKLVISRTVILVSNGSTKIIGQNKVVYCYNISSYADWKNLTNWTQTQYKDGVVAISGDPNQIASHSTFESLFSINQTENIPATLLITCLSSCAVYLNSVKAKQIYAFINQSNGINGHNDYCSYNFSSFEALSVVLKANITNNLTIINSHYHCREGRDLYAEWLVFEIYSNYSGNSSSSNQTNASNQSNKLSKDVGIVVLEIAGPILLLLVLILIINKVLSTSSNKSLNNMEENRQLKSESAKNLTKQTL